MALPETRGSPPDDRHDVQLKTDDGWTHVSYVSVSAVNLEVFLLFENRSAAMEMGTDCCVPASISAGLLFLETSVYPVDHLEELVALFWVDAKVFSTNR